MDGITIDLSALRAHCEQCRHEYEAARHAADIARHNLMIAEVEWQRAEKAAAQRVNQAMAQAGFAPVGIEGTPIDQVAQLREADRQAMAKLDQWKGRT